MSLACPKCLGLHFKNELMSSCCANGKIILLPSSRVMLFIQKSNSFRKNIRNYINANAFASFGAKNIEYTGTCIKINGSIYHNKNTMKFNSDLNDYLRNISRDNKQSTLWVRVFY